jgi:F-type H+-transporting ATPase subunit b
MSPVLLGITDLGINIPVLIAQLINFTILLVVLRAVLYKPVLRMLDERRTKIEESLSAAERMKRQAAEADRQVQEQIEQARREGQALVAQAQEIAARIQAEAREQARADAEALLARARSEIQLERDNAIAELRKEFADVTIRAAEKVIRQSLDREAHRKLIEETLAESALSGDGSRRN